VPKDFVAYRDSQGNYLQGDDNKWHNANTVMGRVKNLGRAAASVFARGGEALHNKAAALSRKLKFGDAIIGVAGVVGGEQGRAKAQRIFGERSARISHGEKEFLRQQQDARNAIGIAKDPNTGLVSIIPPEPPKGTTYIDENTGIHAPAVGRLIDNFINRREVDVNKEGTLTYT